VLVIHGSLEDMASDLDGVLARRGPLDADVVPELVFGGEGDRLDVLSMRFWTHANNPLALTDSGCYLRDMASLPDALAILR